MTDDTDNQHAELRKPGRIPLVLMRPLDGESQEDFAERFLSAMTKAMAERKQPGGESGRRQERDN